MVYSQTRVSLTLTQSAINDWQLGERTAFEVGNSLDYKYKFKLLKR